MHRTVIRPVILVVTILVLQLYRVSLFILLLLCIWSSVLRFSTYQIGFHKGLDQYEFGPSVFIHNGAITVSWGGDWYGQSFVDYYNRYYPTSRMNILKFSVGFRAYGMGLFDRGAISPILLPRFVFTLRNSIVSVPLFPILLLLSLIGYKIEKRQQRTGN
jgi:hypothetical protein